MTRSALLETLRQDYIATTRAKGLRARTVIRRHALRNALIPVTTLGGFTVAGLLGGVVLTETIFEYPGIGAAAGQAAAQLDVITTLAFTLLGSVILVLPTWWWICCMQCSTRACGYTRSFDHDGDDSSPIRR